MPDFGGELEGKSHDVRMKLMHVVDTTVSSNQVGKCSSRGLFFINRWSLLIAPLHLVVE